MYVLGMARTDVRVMREATALQRAGMDITVVDIERDSNRPCQEDVNRIHMKHITMPRWFMPERFKPWFLIKMIWLMILGTLKLINTPADIYHAHDDTALPACYLAARIRGKPLIFDSHELPLVEPMVTRWKLLCTLGQWLLRHMMVRCSGVITVSRPIMYEMQRRYGGPMAVVIRNIPSFQSPAASNALRAYLGLSADTHIALYQGNLDSRGLDKLILAARFLNPGNMIIMMGQGVIRSELERSIMRERVGDRVKIIPPVPYTELLTWTASADIGLVVYSPDAASTITPNIQMCLPNKLFEYVMAGLPVLASSLNAVADLIKTYEVGRIVPSHEPEEIGHAINAMLEDRQALVCMRANALAATRQDLNWERESKRLIDFYGEIRATR
ncbi:glycosyl transferase [Dictyobacter sp. S3.2.2.5]|uniref:Glycosyl transferase n=2 Tax=Dictyobacter halimunensis TaxID=3026934 RepID=A0ABQ6FQV9_9CHLR|nr:glycosyl transferase [Dictyobacter sp. S3.2.2.5]